MPAPRRRHKSICFALGGIAAFLSAWASFRVGFLRNVELLSYDLRITAAKPARADERIVHVDIDDASVKPDRLGRWPWHRDVHARLVDLLTELGAEAIVFDVEFVEPEPPYLDPARGEAAATAAELVVGGPEHPGLAPQIRKHIARVRDLLDEGKTDEADRVLFDMKNDLGPYEAALQFFFEKLAIRPDEEFADAIRRSGRVVLPVRFGVDSPTNRLIDRVRESSWPVPEPDPWEVAHTRAEISREPFASGALAFGAVNMSGSDGDRIFRRSPTVHRFAGRLYGQLGLRVALQTGHWSLEPSPSVLTLRNERGEAVEIPVMDRGTVLLDWPGGDFHGWFRRHSYWDVHAPADSAHRIDRWFAELEQLAAILEIGGIAWPPRGAGHYLKAGTWELQRAALPALASALETAAARTPEQQQALKLARDRAAAVRAEDAVRESRMAPLREAFRGKIVFIGSTETAGTDLKSTPVHPNLPGVCFHSVLTSMVLQRRFVRPLSERAGFLIVVALAVAAMALGAYGRPVLAAPATAAMLAVYVGAAFVIFSGARLVLPVVPPIVSAGSAIVVMLAYRLATEERERRKIRGLFQLYATRELVDRLEEDPARAGLGGERREITVMFTDVHGFTSFVENNPLPVVVRTLNDYLETITQVVLKHGGYVNKYLGDGMMALFGVFHGTPREAAEGACLAALELQERLKGFALRQVGLQRPLQETRVGIASGAAVVGNFGSGRRPEYTAVGDAVNVAARLQVLNKKTGTLVLVDDATRELVGGGFQAAPLGPHPVEGRAKPVEVFVLTSAAPATPGGRPGASGPP